MDHDADMIRVLEGRGAPIERRVIEVPARRSEPPDELRKIAAICLVAGAAAFRGEIELVPPFELGFRWQRHLVGVSAADQVTAHRDQGFAALRPKRRNDVGGPRAPVETGDDRLLDSERIHQRDDVDGDHRLLAIPRRLP